MRKNNDWNRVTYVEYGDEKCMTNPKKDYTLLHNAKVKQYCVAWDYNKENNTWSQGHYFETFDEAVVFMFS